MIRLSRGHEIMMYGCKGTVVIDLFMSACVGIEGQGKQEELGVGRKAEDDSTFWR